MIDTFANRLKQAMKIKDINLSKLSNITGISKPLISNYLSGNYKAKQQNIYKLAKALEVTPAWLMGYDVDIDDTFITENDFLMVEENIGKYKKGQTIKGKDIKEYTKLLAASLANEKKELYQTISDYLYSLAILFVQKNITKEEYENKTKKFIKNLLKKETINEEQYKILHDLFCIEKERKKKDE